MPEHKNIIAAKHATQAALIHLTIACAVHHLSASEYKMHVADAIMDLNIAAEKLGLKTVFKPAANANYVEAAE
tara:strand:+ start:476 stop:694 length:219 start_codon:yes stop_codon:yes gene_type:complete